MLAVDELCNRYNGKLLQDVCRISEKPTDEMIEDIMNIDRGSVWVRWDGKSLNVLRRHDAFQVSVTGSAKIRQSFRTKDDCEKGIERRKDILNMEGHRLEGICMPDGTFEGKVTYLYRSIIPADIERERRAEMLKDRIKKADRIPELVMRLFPENFGRRSQKLYVII